MKVSQSLQLLAFGNLLHFIAVLLLVPRFDSGPMSDNPNLAPIFWSILLLLMIDLGVNANFLTDIMMLRSERTFFLPATIGFVLISLLFRIEVTHYFIYTDYLILTYKTVQILLLSSLLFGYCIYSISKMNIASGFQKPLEILGGGNMIIAGLSFISYNLGLLDVNLLLFELYLVNWAKYIALPLVSAILFYIWSFKIDPRFQTVPKSPTAVQG